MKVKIIVEVETSEGDIDINSDMFADVKDYIEDLFWVGVVKNVDIKKV
jgi:hypothetical protein